MNICGTSISVCSQLPALEICRLLFNFCSNTRDRLSQYSVLPPLMTLPCLSNTTHLRTLSIGIKTSHFLERLLVCIPLIENLSVGVHDSEKYENDNFSIFKLPAAVNTYRQPLAVIIQENSCFSCSTSDTYSFIVYTLPYNDIILETSLFSENLQISCQISVHGIKLFLYANELSIEVCKRGSRLIDLKIDDEDGNLVHALLNNKDNLGTIVNQQNLISTKF
ncbi:unnamed protein product [Rotaria sordida]|uniref:Uncharacterized protein n=1 Tax=Rotaria sordida TaxID=392033 RepID=A0A819QA12_9BILA|nr:unnamed protein product [Rotaria sordida]